MKLIETLKTQFLKAVSLTNTAQRNAAVLKAAERAKVVIDMLEEGLNDKHETHRLATEEMNLSDEIIEKLHAPDGLSIIKGIEYITQNFDQLAESQLEGQDLKLYERYKEVVKKGEEHSEARDEIVSLTQLMMVSKALAFDRLLEDHPELGTPE